MAAFYHGVAVGYDGGMSERPIDPTDPEREKQLGRIALWLDPADLEYLSRHCCCPPDVSEEQRTRCGRLRFRAAAALHKAGLSKPDEPPV
jgi:hypothetical protein